MTLLFEFWAFADIEDFNRIFKMTVLPNDLTHMSAESVIKFLFGRDKWMILNTRIIFRYLHSKYIFILIQFSNIIHIIACNHAELPSLDNWRAFKEVNSVWIWLRKIVYSRNEAFMYKNKQESINQVYRQRKIENEM